MAAQYKSQITIIRQFDLFFLI